MEKGGNRKLGEGSVTENHTLLGKIKLKKV